LGAAVSAVLAGLIGNAVDVTPGELGFAASYSGKDRIATEQQEITAINQEISLRLFWYMSGTVKVYVEVNGVVVATTGDASKTTGSLNFTVVAGDLLSFRVDRSAVRTGYVQILNMSDGGKQLAYITVSIT